MSRSVRTIRRLRAAVAKLDRNEMDLEVQLPHLAEDHLLRVITVFRYGKQSWPQGSEQDDKWSFCLTAGTLCPANQERQ